MPKISFGISCETAAFADSSSAASTRLRDNILDFYCHRAQLAIELDGSGHSDAQQAGYDAERSKVLEGAGVRVLRFWNDDLLKNTEAVLEVIHAALFRSTGKTSPHPACGHPLPEGEG